MGIIQKKELKNFALIMEAKKKIFELKKWNAVAVWSWATEIENCAICKQFLTLACPQCANTPGSKCQIVWGGCNHPYHAHCLNRWLESKNTCPLCSAEWVASRYENS